MLDRFLPAPYPDARPLTISEAATALRGKGDLERLRQDGSVDSIYHYQPDSDGPTLKDMFIWLPMKQKLLWRQSVAPLSIYAAVTALLTGMTGFWLYGNWAWLSGDQVFWLNIVPVILLLVAGWFLAQRWVKYSTECILTLNLPHDFAAVADMGGGANHLPGWSARDYTSDQIVTFHDLVGAYQADSLGFRQQLVTTGQGKELLSRLIAERRYGRTFGHGLAERCRGDADRRSRCAGGDELLRVAARQG